MTAAPSVPNASIKPRRRRPARADASVAALRAAGMPFERARLSCRLRRVLTDNPNVRHFTVQDIVQALGPDDAASSVALFAAAGAFDAPDAAAVSGAATSVLGAGLALGGRSLHLPRALLRRRIPRNSLALLIHGIATLLENADGLLRERCTWVFHPLMCGTLGVILFLLGLASMTPIIGGGVQHAASAFFIAVGIAERDGLVVMLGALAGIACLALAVLGVASGRKLWTRIKSWLLQCARMLRLDALARMLDRCCDGLGDLVRLRWSGLLLLMLSPVVPAPRRPRPEGSAGSLLRERVHRARRIADRAYGRQVAQTHEP